MKTIPEAPHKSIFDHLFKCVGGNPLEAVLPEAASLKELSDKNKVPIL